MTTTRTYSAAVVRQASIPITVLGFSLRSFFAISFIACLLLALVVPPVGMHRPRLQFFPGFEWNVRGVAIGLAFTQLFACWVAVVFGTQFNFFANRTGNH